MPYIAQDQPANGANVDVIAHGGHLFCAKPEDSHGRSQLGREQTLRRSHDVLQQICPASPERQRHSDSQTGLEAVAADRCGEYPLRFELIEMT